MQCVILDLAIFSSLLLTDYIHQIILKRRVENWECFRSFANITSGIEELEKNSRFEGPMFPYPLHYSKYAHVCRCNYYAEGTVTLGSGRVRGLERDLAELVTKAGRGLTVC